MGLYRSQKYAQTNTEHLLQNLSINLPRITRLKSLIFSKNFILTVYIILRSKCF